MLIGRGRLLRARQARQNDVAYWPRAKQPRFSRHFGKAASGGDDIIHYHDMAYFNSTGA